MEMSGSSDRQPLVDNQPINYESIDVERGGRQHEAQTPSPPTPALPLQANPGDQLAAANQRSGESDAPGSREQQDAANQRSGGSDAPSSRDKENAAKRKRCCLPRIVTVPELQLIAQLLKIGLIIYQIVQFGHERSEIIEFFEGTERTLQHLLLKDWEASYETMPYPPASGDFAVYTVDDLLDHVQYTWAQYYNMSRVSLAYITPLPNSSTDEPLPIRLCNHFNNYKILPNGSYIVYPGFESLCVDLDPLQGADEYNIRTFLQQKNLTITFPKLIEMTLDFTFTTFHLDMADTHWGPTCFKVNTTIRYTNYKRSGQLQITLDTNHRERTCTGRIMSDAANAEEDHEKTKVITIDSVVIGVCALSALLFLACLIRSIGYRYWLLGKMAGLVIIIIGDSCTIAGSAKKIKLENREMDSSPENYRCCSIQLGLGLLMSCTGVLRYLDCFKEWRILIRTLKSALPAAVEFFIFAVVMFVGFLFCGWLVLAPYNIKFRDLSMSAECLFGLMNGDETFVTFTATTTADLVLWYFSRVYLYAFNCFFVFCIISVFISIFTNTYETLKEKTDDLETDHPKCRERFPCFKKNEARAAQGEQPRAEEQQDSLESSQGRQPRAAEEQQPNSEGAEGGEGDEERTRQDAAPSPWRAENAPTSIELHESSTKPSSE